MKYKIGVIRVITINDKKSISLHGKLLENYFPEFITVSRCIEDQYNGIHDKDTYKLALPKIVQLGKEMEGTVDGIIISCAADPGVEKLKNILKVPVTGAGSASALYSLSLGENVGVLGIGTTVLNNINEFLGDNLKKYKIVKSINSTHDLKTEIGKKDILKSARILKKAGIDVIILACTGMSTNNIAAYLKKEIDIPVVDPVLAAGLFMYGHCVMKYKNSIWGDS